MPPNRRRPRSRRRNPGDELGTAAGLPPESGSGAATTGWFAAASAAANVLGYVTSVVLSRGLSPADFGAAGALLAIGLIGFIPASALQLVVAARSAQADRWGPGSRVSRRAAAAPALGVGGALAVAGVALAPLLRDYLHLASALPVVLVWVAVVPMVVTGAMQGLLLGRRRFGRLATSALATALTRIVAVWAALALGGGLVAVLVAVAGASVLAAGATALLAAERGTRVVPLGAVWRATLSGSVLLTAFFALTNVDVPLARHYLPPDDSGTYVLGSLFAKACLWGPQFLAVMAFPRLVDPRRHRRSLLVTLGATAAVGLVGVAVAATAGGAVARRLSGAEYSDVGGVAGWFALLGLLWALVNVMVLADISRRRRAMAAGLWAVVVAEVVAVGLVGARATPSLVVGVALCCAAAAVVVGYLATVRVTGRTPEDRGPAEGQPTSLAGQAPGR